jgi:ADP-heptose:LPS heptosyltransferase
MSLPLAFGTTIETVPRFDRYMYPDPKQLKVWQCSLGRIKGPKIGIMVEGSRSFAADERGVCLSELAQFLPRSFNYVLLHKNVKETELAFLHDNENWLSPSPTFSEAAAICQMLYSVISIDTSIAHLSAALGTPTTILLPFRPDWRWAHSGSRTPWYPSAKLVRQTEYGNWRKALSIWHNDCLLREG